MAATASRYGAGSSTMRARTGPLTHAITRGAVTSASPSGVVKTATQRPSSQRSDETRADRSSRTPWDSTCRAKAAARAPVPPRM